MLKTNFTPLIICFALCLVGCNEKASKNIGSPSKQFQNFTSILDDLNLVADAARLVDAQLYNELDQSQLTHFKKHPFYPIPYSKSQFNHIATIEKFTTIDTTLFQDVKYIWGYFYRAKNARGMISDGIIEEWTFANHENAQKALEDYKKVGDHVFFNTLPYFCRIENRLYVFHTRAMAFSYEQKAVFEKFVESNNIQL